MGETVSVRLKEKEIRFIEELSRKQKVDKSTAARELIGYGKIYLVIKLYKEGKISVEKIAKELELSVSEAIDMLAEFGIKAPIDFEDYLKGYKLEKVF